MALVVKDRVKETTNTTGTGTLTLNGAADGFQSFSVIGDGNTCYYAIVSTNDWEVGLGTYTASGTTLSRDTVLESSNSGSLLTLTGTSDVFVTYPAEKSGHKDATNTIYSEQVGASNGIFVNATTVSANFTVPNNYHALSVGPVTVNGGVSVTVPSGSNWKVI
jgi:hypothetical protein